MPSVAAQAVVAEAMGILACDHAPTGTAVRHRLQADGAGSQHHIGERERDERFGGRKGRRTISSLSFATTAIFTFSIPGLLISKNSIATARVTNWSENPKDKGISAYSPIRSRSNRARASSLSKRMVHDLTKEELGGAEIHSKNGAIDIIVKSEQEAIETAKSILSYLPSSVYELPPRYKCEDDP